MESNGFLDPKRIFFYSISLLSKIATSAPEGETVEHVMFLSEASNSKKRNNTYLDSFL